MVASIREQILDKGLELTTGDRNESYGDFTANMETMANLLNILLPHLNAITATDCCTMMMASKLAREVVSPKGQYAHRDNGVDGVVYWAARYEVAHNSDEEV